MFKSNKASKSHSAAFWVIGAFTGAIEFMLGVNAAWLVFQSIIIVVRSMLEGTPIVSLASLITGIVSLSVGLCFMAGGLWAFSGFMDSLDDAKAFKLEYHTGNWPVNLVWALIIAIVSLDLTTLLFRFAYFAEKGAIALLAFFLILIFLPPILGALVFVLENTPRERQLSKVRMQAVSQEASNTVRMLQTMDPDLQSQWIAGDRDGALKTHYERVEDIRKDSEEYERQQMEAKMQGDANRGIGTVTRPLAHASLAQQADERS